MPTWLKIALGLAIVAGVFLFAESCGDSRASKRWQQKYDETMKQVAVHEKAAADAQKAEAVLAEQNRILKETNERQAELLTGHGNKLLAKQAESLKAIQADKEAKLNAIAKTPDDEQGCALCREAKEAGIMFKMCAGICN